MPLTTSKPLAVSIIVPVMDETVSLRETVEIVLAENTRREIREIICVVSKLSTPNALEVCRGLECRYPGIVSTRLQQKPYLGGALQDAFSWASGTHILLMASDLETDPHTVRSLLSTAREGWDIVATTRWVRGGGFKGYNPVKLIANWIFQKAIGLMYNTNLTDLTYGFRIWRSETLRGRDWQELRHPFLLECLLAPLRDGASATELPVQWTARKEGESHNPFWRNFLYLRIALKLRFQKSRKSPARQIAATP